MIIERHLTSYNVGLHISSDLFLVGGYLQRSCLYERRESSIDDASKPNIVLGIAHLSRISLGQMNKVDSTHEQIFNSLDELLLISSKGLDEELIELAHPFLYMYSRLG